MAKSHSPFVQVIGRHFDGHFVASQHTNTVLAHLSAAVSNELMAVFQSHAKSRIWQYFVNSAQHLD